MPQAGEFGKLTGSTTTGFTYTTKTGTAYAFDTTANHGRLLSITPADNFAVSISYSATAPTQISQVSLATGPILTFTWGTNDISSIAAPSAQSLVGVPTSCGFRGMSAAAVHHKSSVR